MHRGRGPPDDLLDGHRDPVRVGGERWQETRRVSGGVEGAADRVPGGVTRDTVLALAPEFELKAAERPVTFTELREGIADGTVIEVFAAGTAAVLTPVTGIKGEGYELTVGDGTPGERTAALRARVLGIQYGRVEDPYGWMRQVV
ncbi:hypothetical protein ABTZ59_34955 [Streptomyces sp. NPDC094034]|uniref:hypothetical protein n=1 Tax=Streptomyces sp. NPDC094034 TaxID=3155309 RepID=UPI00332F1F19